MGQLSVRAGMWLVVILLAAGVWMSGPSAALAEEKGNVVFFRGGYAGLTSDRSGEVFTDVFGASGRNDGNSGYYVGAGLDLMLSKDFWGMMNDVEAVGEIGVEFKRFNSQTVLEAVPSTCAAASVATCSLRRNTVQLTMLTVDVAPKLKFRQGSAFRPWIIPIGLDIHVISPPSNNAGYLDAGVQFGAGFEYAVWKAFKVGLDARYHLTARMTSTNNDYLQAGPYLGITF